jgi:hypothetical protein
MISQPTPLSPTTCRVAGSLAVAGGLTNLVADYLLRGGPAPVSGAAITLEALGSAPFDLVFAGSVLGAAAIPFWLLGLWPVYKALEPAGQWLAAVPVLFFAYGVALASGYHGSYAFYAAGYQALGAAAGNTEPILAEMIERFRAYHDALLMLMVPPWMVGSLVFVAVAAFFRTHYARWMAVASPILVPLTVPLAEALPAPLGGYVRPILGTAIWTLFFLVATIVTWNLGTTSESSEAVM